MWEYVWGGRIMMITPLTRDYKRRKMVNKWGVRKKWGEKDWKENTRKHMGKQGNQREVFCIKIWEDKPGKFLGPTVGSWHSPHINKLGPKYYYLSSFWWPHHQIISILLFLLLFDILNIYTKVCHYI